MDIRIIGVGAIKEDFYRNGIDEYLKRLGKYARVEMVRMADEPVPAKLNDSLAEAIMHKEAQRILSSTRDKSVILALDIQGKVLSSENLASFLEEKALMGQPKLDIIIGGTLGLHPSIKKMSHYRFSLSKMTFPHQLVSLILTEQLFRAFKIIRNEPYHK